MLHFQRIADQCCELLASPTLLGRDLRPLLFGDGFTAEEAQQEGFGVDLRFDMMKTPWNMVNMRQIKV